jgi:DNA-binding HxlR family transcriptional regulator
LAERELDEKIFGILEAKGMTFNELLKRVPEARPLSIKQTLDRLEKDGRVIRVIREGKYTWDVVK